MGELSGIEPPRMNWLATDLPTEFRSFRQYCELIFSGPFAEKRHSERVLSSQVINSKQPNLGLTQESLRMVTAKVLVVLSGSFTSQIQTGPTLT